MVRKGLSENVAFDKKTSTVSHEENNKGQRKGLKVGAMFECN